MFQVCIGRVLGSANTGMPVNFLDGDGAPCGVDGLTVTIEGCPYSGLEAVDFRRAHGIPDAPSNKIKLPPHVWLDEKFVRENLSSDYRDQHCDLRLEYKSAHLWVEPKAIAAYLNAIAGGSGVEEAGRALVLSALQAADRSRARAEAEREALLPEIQERAREKSEREAATARERAEAAARTQAGIDSLREWARHHASDLLAARIQDGYEWVGLAEREFANQQVCGLGEEVESPGEPSVSPRTTPTLDEIQRLRHVRSLLDLTHAKAELVWCVYEVPTEDEYGETNETEKIKRAEVKVTVECPTGRTIEYYYGIEPESKCGCTATVRCDDHKAI